MRARAIGWAGIRRPTVGRPAETMAGIVHDEGAAEVCSAGRTNACAAGWDLGSTSVRGPGQNRRGMRGGHCGHVSLLHNVPYMVGHGAETWVAGARGLFGRHVG